MLILRSTLYAMGQACSTILVATLGLLTLPFPYRTRYRCITLWTRFNLWWLEKSCGLRCEIEGLEHVPAEPCIVFSRHESAWETLALQKIFNPQVWVLKREILWLPFFGWAIAMLKPIAINRSSARRALVQLKEQGRARLQEGCWVVIFPEGTRLAPGGHRRYGRGGASLAEESGYPVVPVAHNAGDFWPRKSFLKLPGTIRLVVGPAIESKGRSAIEINALAEAWIGETVARLRDIPANT